MILIFWLVCQTNVQCVDVVIVADPFRVTHFELFDSSQSSATGPQPSRRGSLSKGATPLSPSRWDDFEDPQSNSFSRPSPPSSAQFNFQIGGMDCRFQDSQAGTPASSKQSSLSRKETRRNKAAAYKAIRDAHAKGIRAKYKITTSPEDEILTGKLKWMAAVRASAIRTVDFSICEFRRHHHQWEWALSIIEKEVDEQF